MMIADARPKTFAFYCLISDAATPAPARNRTRAEIRYAQPAPQL
jgi:hypothetical protein